MVIFRLRCLSIHFFRELLPSNDGWKLIKVTADKCQEIFPAILLHSAAFELRGDTGRANIPEAGPTP
jgi:hypothetical protein